MSMGINHDMDKFKNQSMDKSIEEFNRRFFKKFSGIFMRWVLLCLAVVFILLGIYRGETQDVLRKAVNICLECIGIG